VALRSITLHLDAARFLHYTRPYHVGGIDILGRNTAAPAGLLSSFILAPRWGSPSKVISCRRMMQP